MKSKLLILLTILGFAAPATACDICGCGAGNSYLGILPEFNNKIIGLRFRANDVTTHLGPDGNPTYLTTQESYRTAELWGGWTIANRFRIMANIPVSYDSKTSAEDKGSKTGLGDIGVQGFYHLLNIKKTTGNSHMLVHDLWIGGGIKLPSGKYEEADHAESAQTGNLFQLGTGSTDFLLIGMYDIRYQDAGLNISASYKMNTENQYSYNYGNKFSSSAQLYYKFRIKGLVTLSPNAGLGYERSARDIDQGYDVYNTGGNILTATAGAELVYDKVALGGNFQPIISQNLAEGAIHAHNKMMLHIGFMF